MPLSKTMIAFRSQRPILNSSSMQFYCFALPNYIKRCSILGKSVSNRAIGTQLDPLQSHQANGGILWSIYTLPQPCF